MEYIIHPYEGVHDWYFGMNREEIRKIVGLTPKVLTDIYLDDMYRKLGLYFSFYYGEPFIFHALMVILPACICIDGKNLLGGDSIEDLGNWFKERYDSVEIKGDGVFIYSLGIYLSTQDFELFGQEPPESVVVFSRDSPYASRDSS